MIGKDWAQVTSVGYYYSFGYSFLLLPCLAAVPDPVTAYRLGTACNALFLCISLLALYRFMKKMCPETDDKKRAFFLLRGHMLSGSSFLYADDIAGGVADWASFAYSI